MNQFLLLPGNDDEAPLPANLILLSDGAAELPAGWTPIAPTVVGSYLAAGSSRGHGGAATHGHTSVAAHNHEDSGNHTHAWHLGTGPTYEESIAKGDEALVFGAPHEHTSADQSPGPTGAAADEATTVLSATDNELSHKEVRLVKNTGGARRCDGLLCLGIDGPLGDDWPAIGDDGGPSADFAGRFLKLVDDEPASEPAGDEEHAHAVAAHHATHGTYSHDHGPAADTEVDFDATDPTDISTDTSAASGGNARAHAASHGHTITVPGGATDTASPNVTSTAGDSEPVATAATLDRFVVDLFQAAERAGLVAGMIALWDDADGDVPAGWSAVEIDAANNAPYVQVRGALESPGEVERSANPNEFSATHTHGLAAHGHTTTAVGGDGTSDPSAPGEDAVETLPDYHDWPISLASNAEATLTATETAWTTTPAADSYLPLFERFVLIRKT